MPARAVLVLVLCCCSVCGDVGDGDVAAAARADELCCLRVAAPLEMLMCLQENVAGCFACAVLRSVSAMLLKQWRSEWFFTSMLWVCFCALFRSLILIGGCGICMLRMLALWGRARDACTFPGAVVFAWHALCNSGKASLCAARCRQQCVADSNRVCGAHMHYEAGK